MLKHAGFTKYVDVFCIPVATIDSVSNERLLEVAAILAQYLDNNEDGYVDDPKLLDSLLANRTIIPLLLSDHRDRISKTIYNYIAHYNSNLTAAALVFSENYTENKMEGYEEINHILFDTGYSIIYADAFEISSNSQIAQCMDIARGGHFRIVPHSYPDKAWYTYDDESCDYECMITEYFYWAMTSIAGIQNNRNIDHACQSPNEWNLCSRKQVKRTDPCIYNLITNHIYKLPLNNNWNRNYTANILKIRLL